MARPMNRCASRLAALVLPLSSGLVGLGGCHGHQGPEDAFRAFTLASLAHQGDAAWALLSHDSQAAMTEATQQAVAQAPKGAVPTDPKAFLFGEDAQLARPVTEIKLLDATDKLAHLQVTTAEGAHPVTLVYEDGWKLDLTDGLKF